mmetsp:Transcript_145101/g.361936  ORF Transcript_145101/g.361936 Transcript_145101/m.361936 type:complete len:156 (-) Transcript_145101:120-587(-)
MERDARVQKSSIYEPRAPQKRYQRKLSSSKVGLAGASPMYAEIPHVRRSKSQQAREKMTVMMLSEDPEYLLHIWIQSEEYPLQNYEMVKVRNRIVSLLRKQCGEAVQADDMERLCEIVAKTEDMLLMLRITTTAPWFKKAKQILIDRDAEMNGSP